MPEDKIPPEFTETYFILMDFVGRGASNNFRGLTAKKGLKILGSDVHNLGFNVKKMVRDGYLRLLTAEEKQQNPFDSAFNLEMELEKQTKKELTETIIQEPNEQQLIILRSSDLLDKILTEVSKQVVGENKPIKTIILVSTGGSIVINASPTSTNLCISSKSGSGKDAVATGCLSVHPEETKVFKRTKLTSQAFTYWKKKDTENGFTWNGKIVYLEDCSNALLNSDVFKTMASGGSKATVVKEQIAIDIIINGKPVLIITTAEGEPNLETLRRFPLIYLDESEEQTNNIISQQALEAEGGSEELPNKELSDALKCLKPCKVIVPFATKIADYFKKYAGSILFRTHFKRILDYVKFSTAIHQYQRKRDDKGNIIATWDDWNIVRPCIELITKNKRGFNLTHKQQKVIDILGQTKQLDVWMSVPEIMTKNPPYSEKGLYKTLDKLVEFGVLSIKYEQQEKRKDLMLFKIKDADNELAIPESNTLLGANNSDSTNSSSSSNSTISNTTELIEQPEQKEPIEKKDNSETINPLERDKQGKCNYCLQENKWVTHINLSNSWFVCHSCAQQGFTNGGFNQSKEVYYG